MSDTLRNPPEPFSVLLQGLSKHSNGDLNGAEEMYSEVCAFVVYY